MIIWMFRCHLGEVPNYLRIEFHAPGRLGIKAVMLPLSTNGSGRAQQIYKESFAVICPKLGMFCQQMNLLWTVPGRSREFSLSGASNILLGLRLRVTDA